MADLVAAEPGVPRLGNQLDRSEHRILGHRIEEARVLIERPLDAGERGREIEAEAVDPHLLDPIAQGVRDHAQHIGVAQLQRVARAGEVVIEALVVHQIVV